MTYKVKSVGDGYVQIIGEGTGKKYYIDTKKILKARGLIYGDEIEFSHYDLYKKDNGTIDYISSFSFVKNENIEKAKLNETFVQKLLNMVSHLLVIQMISPEREDTRGMNNSDYILAHHLLKNYFCDSDTEYDKKEKIASFLSLGFKYIKQTTGYPFFNVISIKNEMEFGFIPSDISITNSNILRELQTKPVPKSIWIYLDRGNYETEDDLKGIIIFFKGHTNNYGYADNFAKRELKNINTQIFSKEYASYLKLSTEQLSGLDINKFKSYFIIPNDFKIITDALESKKESTHKM